MRTFTRISSQATDEGEVQLGTDEQGDNLKIDPSEDENKIDHMRHIIDMLYKKMKGEHIFNEHIRLHYVD